MQPRQGNGRRGPRYSVAGAALGIAVLVTAAGCAALHVGGPSGTPPPTPGLSPSTVPSANPTATPSPTLEITAPPATAPPTIAPPTPPPLAGSLPVVDSCNPASVPGAIPVTAPASGTDSSFALRVPILEYHRIVPFAQAGDSRRSLVVPPATFAAQLDVFKKAGWHTITMATLANDLQARIKPPAKTFVITIDDGWDDGYTYALPILQQDGFVATYFVIAGRIDLPGILTSAHLQALVAAGEEIGDHTMDHVRLTQQTYKQLTYQIDAAAARIAQVTGYWPESLAYPYGSVSAGVEAGVAACQGLRIAVVEKGGTAKVVVLETWANRFAVPRIEISSGTKMATLLADLGG